MRTDEDKKTGWIILILIAIIFILAGFIFYTQIGKQAVEGYIIKKQLEAKDIVLNSIISQVNQNGFVDITDSNGNKMTLVVSEQPYN